MEVAQPGSGLYLLLRIKLSSQSGKICELFLLKIRPLSQPLLLPLVVEIPLVEFPITCFCECNGHEGRVWVFLQKKGRPVVITVYDPGFKVW